ncbi:fungal-specific transcription factor domain-containing protein, partial [Talaromyces proteolyticus]
NNFLPAYIQPFPSDWPPYDVEFLKRKGAFTLPSDELRNALIDSYISWVHSSCPVIELHELLSQVLHCDGSKGRVSLMVLYAVMFSAVAFVPFKFLRRAGYAVRQSARELFYFRVKLLYDFRYEEDRIRTIQALLLVSYWQDKHDALQNHWYWVALANAIGRTISLHRDPGEQLSPQAAGLRRRLGWTCFARDRVLSIGLRQTPSILLKQFTLRPLEVSDFNIQPFSSEILETFGQSKLLIDQSSQIALAEMYIAQIQLAVILDQVFDEQYTTQILRPCATNELTTALIERDYDNAIEKHVSTLQNWLSQLPESCQYRPTPTPFLKTVDKIVLLHRAFLNMFYHTVHLALFQPQLHKKEVSEAALHQVRLSSVMITRVVEELQNHGALRFLQSAAVSMLVRAAVSHLYEYSMMSEAQRDHSLRRFLDCVSYVTQLKDIHMYAGFSSSFLCYSAGKLGISSQLLADSLSFDYGIWEDVHTPERFFKRPTTERSATSSHKVDPQAQQSSENGQNTSLATASPINMFDGSSGAHPIDEETIMENFDRNTNTIYSQVLPSQSGRWFNDIETCSDPTYLASLDAWFRDCFESLIQED